MNIGTWTISPRFAALAGLPLTTQCSRTTALRTVHRICTCGADLYGAFLMPDGQPMPLKFSMAAARRLVATCGDAGWTVSLESWTELRDVRGTVVGYVLDVGHLRPMVTAKQVGFAFPHEEAAE